MRLESFIKSVSLSESDIALPSRELQSYYRDLCIPCVRAATQRSRDVREYDILKGVVLNFVAQMPNKQMLCIGEVTWLDYVFAAYHSQSNLIVVAGLPEDSGLRPVVEGPFGWNICPFTSILPERLITVAKPGFSVLALVVGSDCSRALSWLRAGAPFLVGGGRLVLCGESKAVNALLNRLDARPLKEIAESAAIPCSHDTTFKAVTGTSPSLTAALQGSA